MCIYIHTHIYVCVYIYTYTYIHTYTYICVYIHTHFPPFFSSRGCHLCTPPLLHSRQWVSSSHSSSSTLQNASISWKGVFTHIWCPDFTSRDLVSVTAMQRVSLDRLVLEARWASAPGSHGTVTIQEIVLGKLLPCLSSHTRALHREQTETRLQPFCERSLFPCPRALALGADFRFETYPEAMEVLLGQGSAIFVLSLGHTIACQYLPERNTYTHCSPDFHNCHPGKTSRSRCSGAQQ